VRRGNLLAPVRRSDSEVVEILKQRAGISIERIISTGQSSPPGFWYDQPGDEFVVLLAGSAVLRFESGDELIEMTPGAWIEIPARVRHRVESTEVDPPTVWLAVHITASR
jgi:cupin 2 domain-containing protein